MNQKVDPIHYDFIRDMRQDGATYKEIGDYFGVKAGTIEAILAKVKNRRTTSKIVVPSDDELYQLYILDDRRQHDIAKQYGVSRYTVSRWLKKAEIEKFVDGEGEPKRFNKKEVPDENELFALYILEDMTQLQLMEHYDVSKTTMQKWLKDAELSKRGWYNKEEAR